MLEFSNHTEFFPLLLSVCSKLPIEERIELFHLISYFDGDLKNSLSKMIEKQITKETPLSLLLAAVPLLHEVPGNFWLILCEAISSGLPSSAAISLYICMSRDKGKMTVSDMEIYTLALKQSRSFTMSCSLFFAERFAELESQEDCFEGHTFIRLFVAAGPEIQQSMISEVICFEPINQIRSLSEHFRVFLPSSFDPEQLVLKKLELLRELSLLDHSIEGELVNELGLSWLEKPRPIPESLKSEVVSRPNSLPPPTVESLLDDFFSDVQEPKIKHRNQDENWLTFTWNFFPHPSVNVLNIEFPSDPLKLVENMEISSHVSCEFRIVQFLREMQNSIVA